MAQLILTIPDSDVPRVQAAVGAKLGLPGPATTLQVKNDLVKYMQDMAVGYEQGKNAAALPPPVPIDIT